MPNQNNKLLLTIHTLLALNEKVTHYKPKTILCRNLKTIDLELLTDDLSNTPWHVSDLFTEIDDRIDYWKGLMNYIINYHAPTRRKRMWENDVPYMTSDWKKAFRKKRLFAKLYTKDKTEEKFELKRKYRNLATKECKKAIKQFWKMKSEKIRETQGTSSTLFSLSLARKLLRIIPSL